jgi:hypothetical protein
VSERKVHFISNFVSAWHAAKIMVPQNCGLIVAISGYVGVTYNFTTMASFLARASRRWTEWHVTWPSNCSHTTSARCRFGRDSPLPNGRIAI